MQKLALLVRDVWKLSRGYWVSDERWSALGLLASVIGLNLGMVWVNVLLNGVYGDLYNALQQKKAGAFYAAFGSAVLMIMVYLLVALLRYYLNQTLQLRWRRWLTARYLARWMSNQTFYRMRFAGQVDNPDQRISEDVRLFIENTLSLGLGLISSTVTFVSFAAILWNLSGSLTVPIAGLTIVIPGYMFWAAVLYSGVGSVLAHLVGRPLIRIYNRQQRVEADFRFSLIRIREEGEGIALYGGEEQERGIASGRFQAVYDNFRRLIIRNTQYVTFDLLQSQLAAFFPLLVASPRYFSGAIELGALMQTSRAFGQVNGALSWFIESYRLFAEWRATVDRLRDFSAEIEREATRAAHGAAVEQAPQPTVEIDNVSVALPDGAPLLSDLKLSLKPQESVMLTGRSGSGKTTLFRVLAGLWPFSTGRIRLPIGAKTLFLPQRPYMPIGTLRQALWFPDEADPSADEQVKNALAAVDLPAYADRLDETAHWAQVLSVGEQQRVAIARALLLKPDWLFLDEATSAMDERQEAAIYRTLAEALPKTTIVSIGHRHSLLALHQRVLTVEHPPGAPGRLTEGLVVA
jgi:vitamin B12/bleomycin/antimicrobial peptide transport system ATP-binding/permease protein